MVVIFAVGFSPHAVTKTLIFSSNEEECFPSCGVFNGLDEHKILLCFSLRSVRPSVRFASSSAAKLPTISLPEALLRIVSHITAVDACRVKRIHLRSVDSSSEHQQTISKPSAVISSDNDQQRSALTTAMISNDQQMQCRSPTEPFTLLSTLFYF